MTQAKQLGRERIVTRVKQSSQPAPSGGVTSSITLPALPTSTSPMAHLSSTHPPHPNCPRPLQPFPPAATELYRTPPKDQTTPRNRPYLRARATPGGTAHEASPPGRAPARHRSHPRVPGLPLALRGIYVPLATPHLLAPVARGSPRPQPLPTWPPRQCLALLMQWRRQGDRVESGAAVGSRRSAARGKGAGFLPARLAVRRGGR